MKDTAKSIDFTSGEKFLGKGFTFAPNKLIQRVVKPKTLKIEAIIKFTIENDSSKRYNVGKKNKKPVEFCKIKAIINIPCVKIIHDLSDLCSHSDS